MYQVATWLDKNYPEKAESTYNVITAACQNLVEFPEIGRQGEIQNTRELTLSSLPYRLIYQVTDDKIVILRIYHAARKPLYS